MRYNQTAIRDQERLTMDMMTAPYRAALPHQKGALTGADWAAKAPQHKHLLHPSMWYMENEFQTDPLLITMPATLKQELPFSVKDNYTFNFAANAPNAGPTAALNNIVLAKNNVFGVYAFRFRIGYGADARTRVYQCFGNTPADSAIYQATGTLTVESMNQMTNFYMQDCEQVPEGAVNALDNWDGAVMCSPIRLGSGQLGIFNFTITTINSLAGLSITPNAFLELELKCGIGQASGKAN